ncbi:MAG TPA: site-specific DNA-methyltransferase [Candidatus Paceibacterota bacterium]
MATLNWIGKEAVVNHDKAVPFKLLKKVKSASVGTSQNLIVHGDNLEALKALMPYYVGKIKCIYIDPPYNTGNEGWVYNDKVNSPKIKQWLGKVVGRESEDLTRHDKWLCMMYPRLNLLRDLLADDGAIFVSIDDNEQFPLKLIMDEIFKPENFLCSLIWQKRYGPPPDTKDIGYTHESILAYRKTEKFVRNLLLQSDAQIARYKNPDNDTRGVWKAMDYTCRFSRKERPNLYYPIKNPNTRKEVYPNENRVWAFSQDEHKRNERENRIWWGVNGKAAKPAKKNYLSDVVQGTMPTTLLPYDEVGHTHEATQELQELLPSVKMTPKPTRLIQRILRIASNKDSIILDSFAGSGTTGHAVLDLNKEDGGNRKFILVEMEDAVAKNITTERVKRAIKKYDYKGGFEYCELDKPLFDENGQIEDSCDFKQFATYIYFTETQTNIDAKKIKGNFIGERGETEYYLLYKGKLQNDLDKSVLKIVSDTEKRKVIYADRCLLDDDIRAKHNIVFKQIPYEVKVY